MIPNRLLTVIGAVEYLPMPEQFVEHEIHMDYLDAGYIGHDWRIEPPALAAYIDARRTITPFVTDRGMRAVQSQVAQQPRHSS